MECDRINPTWDCCEAVLCGDTDGVGSAPAICGRYVRFQTGMAGPAVLRVGRRVRAVSQRAQARNFFELLFLLRFGASTQHRTLGRLAHAALGSADAIAPHAGMSSVITDKSNPGDLPLPRYRLRRG